MKLIRADQDGPSQANAIRKLSVLMPVYNEFWTIREIVARVLASPVPLDVELIIVDDCSTDGSWKVIQELASADGRIRPFRHERNRGKGAAIRTAIDRIEGEVAIVQDADLEYDPQEFSLLLGPILEGKADAVFGSRYADTTRRVPPFRHTMINKFLTLLSNVVNNLALSDMETCYKMVRSDILKRLRLKSETFTFEPELTCRLAQWGARIYELPISYSSRTYLDGKKIRARDGLLAIGEIFRAKFLDPRFTTDPAFYDLSIAARARKSDRWIVDEIGPYLGQRVLEAGAGIGTLSGMLVKRQQLVLAEREPICVDILRQRFGWRLNVQVEQADFVRASASENVGRWRSESFDTVVCSQVLERSESDVDVLRSFYDVLAPGGHCVLVVPAAPAFYSDLDRQLGRVRRYAPADLRQKLASAGFEIVRTKRFNKRGGLRSAFPGHLLGGSSAYPGQPNLADRLFPITRLLGLILPVPGMSLIVIGRKPEKVAKRAAA